MKTGSFFICCICILAFAVMPAQAFTSRTLTINISAFGNAQVDFQYELSFVEKVAVFLNVANPEDELRTALKNHMGREVTVVKADSSSAKVIIPSFAQTSVNQSDGKVTMRTPAISFAHAEKVLNDYWFAPLITPDLSPDITTITFPDGYQVIYNNQISIPSVSHALT